MDDNRLAVACVFLALAGIALLVIAVREAKPLAVEISDLDAGGAGKLVEVSGFVSSVSESGGNFFIKICSTGCVKAVVFKKLAEEMRQYSIDLSLLKNGQVITVTGTVAEYAGGIEVVALDRGSVELSGRSG
ncbi:MAG: OB-fold nucleic acid binding domain-containing protein [Candidatus Micrarchaeota archaeon]|nr:OB-fold nucleic acid binding domain-containing protein [Candidatus Micrarchaeota archaeon]